MKAFKLIKTKFLAILLVICLAGFFSNACQSKSEKAKEEIKEAADATEELIETKKEELVRNFKVRRDQSQVRLDTLKKKLEASGEEAKEKMSGVMDDMTLQQDEIEKNFSDLGKTSEEGLETLRTKLDSALTKMEKSLEDAEKQFNKKE